MYLSFFALLAFIHQFFSPLPLFLLSFPVLFCLSDLSVGILPFFILVPRLLKAAKTHPHPTQRSTYGADGWLNIKKAGLFPCEARLFRTVLDCQQEHLKKLGASHTLYSEQPFCATFNVSGPSQPFFVSQSK